RVGRWGREDSEAVREDAADRGAEIGMIAIPRHRTVSDVMTRQVHVGSPSTPFKVLVRLIEDNRVSAIPIVDAQGTPIGVVSETDLVFKQWRQELAGEHDLLHTRKHR